MSVSYNGDHSITFIELYDLPFRITQSSIRLKSYRLSWYDFGLIPLKRPSVSTSQPKLNLIEIPGSNRMLDLTSSNPGGLTYERRTGQWQFYVDTSIWSNWFTAFNSIKSYLHGKRMACVLEDDPNTLYIGNFSVTEWKNDSGYPSVTIDYDLNYDTFINNLSYSKTIYVTSLSATLNSNASTFFVGDNKDNVRKYVTVYAIMSNGSRREVNVDNIQGRFEYSGSQQVQLTYGTISTNISINVIQPVPIKLFVTVNPDLPTIYVGEAKDKIRSYLNTIVEYSNQSREHVEPDIIQGTFNSAGDNEVTIRYKNVSTSISITVVEAEVVSIKASLASQIYDGDAKYFYVNDSISKISNYLTTIATYTDGSTGEVTPELPDGIFTNISAAYPITVTYKGKSDTVSCPVYANHVTTFIVELHDDLPDIYIGDRVDKIRPHITVYAYCDNGYRFETDEYYLSNPSPGSDGHSSFFGEAGENYVEVSSSTFYDASANFSIDVLSKNFKTIVSSQLIVESNCPELFFGDEGDKLLPYSSVLLTFDDGTQDICKDVTDLSETAFLFIGNKSFNIEYTYGAKRYIADNDLVVDVKLGNKTVYDWDYIAELINNNTYADILNIGDLAMLSIDNIYDGYIQIIGIDTDIDENNNPIPITWCTCDTLFTNGLRYASTDSELVYYNNSEINSYLNNLYNQLPSNIQNMIIPAKKSTAINDDDYIFVQSTMEFNDYYKIWIPSLREVFGINYFDSGLSRVHVESTGPIYEYLVQNSTRTSWQRWKWSYCLRSTFVKNFTDTSILYRAYGCRGNRSVYNYNETRVGSTHITDSQRIVMCFCTGRSST